ncbi:protein HEATR9 isoform X3 [Podarcis raffonei]|uniref:protein HEATR9 isoform X3 n=1 Tax=Podarcis raffonei TaxID=65483 RepID=UPI002329509A|nr:protein HEATR9 isoform X3 [Podarcis raffonei]
MGGTKMLPENTCGVKVPQKLSWSSMIEIIQDNGTGKPVRSTLPRSSVHQIPRVTYPCSPSEWRTFQPVVTFVQPRIVEQPDAASLKKQCPYRKKLEKQKKKALKKRSDFSLSKYVKLARIKEKENFSEKENLNPERLKALINYLDSPVELEQLYAAQALGQLGVPEESVTSALFKTFQECNSLPLQYEAARSLALLGCLDTSVVKMLIRHLKDASLNRREDTLSALKVSLQAWSMTPELEWYWIGARSSLIRNLRRLVNLQDPMDSVIFDAALCLGYLDKYNPIAQETMFMCLSQDDCQRKIQALAMLVKQMAIVDPVVIKTVIDQLQRSPLYKHRVDAARLLATIGLEIIQEEGLEEEVFNVLLEKLSEEPFLLRDDKDEIRKKAVIALGVLGIRNKNLFFAMLEMLELDTCEDVRIQVVRAFSTLGMDNMHVRKSLVKKAQTQGILARECSKALESLDKVSDAQKEYMLQSFKIY